MRKLRNEELDRLTVKQYHQSAKIPVAVILDNIRSQNNIGSLFRTADAFRLEGMMLCGITSTPPHREIHKTALGATESVHWEYFRETLEAVSRLKSEGYRILAVEQAENAVSLEKLSLDIEGKYALVFGHEIRGVEQAVIDRCDLCIEIPQFGTKHSLNVAVAAGIVIWEVHRKLSGMLKR
ncbi:MAG: TrmH family RNA methyltransferase [Bacteroidetes bacterium]|nr:MAG: TrmH family RNA methyltransferase [Bacteroidota bacterium]